MTLPTPLIELYRSIEADLAAVEVDLRETLHSDRPEVAEMTAVAAGYGGKRMRPAMVLLVARAAGQPGEKHPRLGAAVEMIHLATLVHDDVIDEAAMRRQQETVNRHWSNHDAVLLGDVLFTRSINLLARLGDQRSLLRITGSVATLCEGEILQNRNRGNLRLAEETYYDIIDAKTAELYAAGCELAAHLAGASEEACEAYRVMGRELGVAFQIVDDILDLAGDEREVGKSLGTDLANGKMTLPLLLLRDDLDRDGAPADREALSQVIVEGADGAPRDCVRALITEHDVLARASARAREHVARGLETVRPFCADEQWPALEAIGAYILARTL